MILDSNVYTFATIYVHAKHLVVFNFLSVLARDATILQYINILAISIAAIQYNTPDKNIDILLLAIYCNTYCLQSCKYLIITLQK